ncbi:TetR/AcrR family transcriptional regulator [Streptomyces umbrinus]|nr:TetR family transcriptional regulator [Streptomyces umbrinus]
MPPDATETKRRLMKAAVDEFATYGLAGARIDRIAETATANKRSIYVHFGTKEELFDIVVADSMIKLAESISFENGSLADYAGDLFDRLERWPHIRRLYLWAGLERQQPVDAEVQQYRKRASAIEAAQQAGKVRADIPAAELMAMVLSLVISWDTTTWSLKALQPENRQKTGPDHRTRVTTAVAALTQPPQTRLPHHPG